MTQLEEEENIRYQSTYVGFADNFCLCDISKCFQHVLARIHYHSNTILHIHFNHMGFVTF